MVSKTLRECAALWPSVGLSEVGPLAKPVHRLHWIVALNTWGKKSWLWLSAALTGRPQVWGKPPFWAEAALRGRLRQWALFEEWPSHKSNRKQNEGVVGRTQGPSGPTCLPHRQWSESRLGALSPTPMSLCAGCENRLLSLFRLSCGYTYTPRECHTHLYNCYNLICVLNN